MAITAVSPAPPAPPVRRPPWLLPLGYAVSVLVLALVAGVVAYTAGGTGEAVTPPAGRPGGAPPQPVGHEDGFDLVFSDEFDGSTVDGAKWTDRSSSQADEGRGNPDNRQLEWNTLDNCTVGGGALTMTARRQPVDPPSGAHYPWTSCLLSSTPGFGFQYGYLEERAVLPSAKGFWPALWTWQVPDAQRPTETDVYEYYTSRPRELELTQHSGARGHCRWRPPFDPAGGWHTYAASIDPTGTTWYVDGVEVCSTPATSDGMTNVVTNLAVYAEQPPAPDTTSAEKKVDYVRVWKRR